MGRCERLEHLFSAVRDSRPETASELRPPTTTGSSASGSGGSGSSIGGSGTGGTGTGDEDGGSGIGESTPAPARRVNRTKKGAAIKQLFTAAAKFQKNLRR